MLVDKSQAEICFVYIYIQVEMENVSIQKID